MNEWTLNYWLIGAVLLIVYLTAMPLLEELQAARERKQRKKEIEQLAKKTREAEKLADRLAPDRPSAFGVLFMSQSAENQKDYNRRMALWLDQIATDQFNLQQQWMTKAKAEIEVLTKPTMFGGRE